MVRIGHGAELHISILCITGVAILQLIKSRYLEEAVSQRQLNLLVSKAGAAAFES